MAKKTLPPETPALHDVVISDRRAEERQDRRKRPERRVRQIPVAVDRRKGERRTGERRRQIDPTTCERDYGDDEIEFMKAIDEYKRDFARPFPTWSEVLEIAKALGYRKVADKTAIAPNRAKANYSDDLE